MNLSVTIHAKDKADLAHQLRVWADHLDEVPESEIKMEKDEEIETDVKADVSDDEDFGADTKKKAAKKKAQASFEDEDTDEEAQEPMEESFDDEDDVKPTKAAKKTAAPAKAKPLTEADVMKACKAYAAEHNVEAAQKILLKKFQTKSVSKLKPEQYAQAIKALEI